MFAPDVLEPAIRFLTVNRDPAEIRHKRWPVNAGLS
jgi:hypothetical protein